MAGNRHNRRPKQEAPEVRWQDLFDDALTGEAKMSPHYGQGYDYSYGNRLYLMSQGAHEPVANMKWWNDHGRSIIKGSSAFYVVRPILRKSKTEVDANGDPVVYPSFTPSKSAFTYSQTEGEPLPESPPNEWRRNIMLGNLAINLVDFEDHSLNMMGYSYGRNAAINPMAPYKDKTATHEAAHIEAGHTSAEFDYNQHRGLAEVEAESTAFIVGHEVGYQMDVEGSRAYIQSYRNLEQRQNPDKQAIPDTSVRKVFRVVDLLWRAGLVDPETGEPLHPPKTEAAPEPTGREVVTAEATGE